MEVKDDIVQIQDINGSSYSIPLEDVDGISIYSDDLDGKGTSFI